MNNWMSDKIDKIAPALLEAQKAIKGAKKDSQNPHLKNKYADLGSVFDACKEHLNENGIAIMQLMGTQGERNTLKTVLMHDSGQFYISEALLPDIDQKGVNAAQAMGSAISYMRRYQLQSASGVISEDDDGHAVGSKPQAEPTITYEELAEKIAEANALPHLANIWDKYKEDMVKMTAQEKKDLAILKDTKKVTLKQSVDPDKEALEKDLARGDGKPECVTETEVF